MSKVEIKKKYNNILSQIRKNPELCQEWKNSNGTIFANKNINPNATSVGSLNVLISDACNTIGVVREDNPYKVSLNNKSLSNIESVTISKNVSKVEKMKEKVRELLEDDSVPAMNKIKKLIGVDMVINNINRTNYVWNPPYYSREDIQNWITNTDINQNDMLLYSPRDQENVDKYTEANYKHYFKILLYAIIYKVSFNHDFLKTDEVKKFRKIVQQAFKEVKLSIYNYEITFKHNFNFLYYNAPNNTLGIKQYKKYENIYINSNKDIHKYGISYYINANPAFKKGTEYIHAIDSIERDKNYESLSTDNSGLDEQPVEYQEKNYPCAYQYKFLESDNKMKQFSKDMIRSCNEFSLKDKGESSILEDYDSKLREMKNAINNNISDKSQYIELEIDTRTPLKSLFEKYISLLTDFNINPLNISMQKLKIKKKSHDDINFYAQDLGGVSNDFFNDISNELFQKKVFVKPDVDILSTNRYFLNPSFKLEDLDTEYKRDIDNLCKKSSKKTSGGQYNEAKLNQFYTFIGDLIIFLFLNNFKLPYHLSSFLLSGFIKKGYREEKGEYYTLMKYSDMIYCMMRDFENAYDILIRQPLRIGYDISGTIEMDTFTSLGLKYDEIKINKDNYVKYLTMLSAYINRYNAIKDMNKSMEINHINYLEAFDNKLLMIRMQTAIYGISLDMIDNNLTRDEITNEIIQEFVNGIEIGHNRRESLEFDDIGVDLSSEIRANLYEYIKSIDDSDRYMRGLLKFWTGKDNYDKGNVYRIMINEKMNSERDRKTLPVSHTCFSTIDVPLYGSFEELIEKLNTSIKHISNSDMAGGAKGKTKMRNITDKAVNKKKW